MDRYLKQLLTDIETATQNMPYPYLRSDTWDIWDWVTEEEDRRTATTRSLPDWTGIRKEQLPPADLLKPEQLSSLLKALDKLLEACNCLIVFQTYVPEDVQYKAIRAMFHQESTWLKWHMNFFEFCEDGQEHYICALGEHCQCGFFEEHFGTFSQDEPDEPEDDYWLIYDLKKRFGNDWKKYYNARWISREEDEDEELD